MRKLTVELIDCSEAPIVDGDERGFADSGEVLRKGSIDYRRFRPPLIDSFHWKVLDVEAQLRSITVELRMASRDGDETWPELGFRHLQRRARERGNGAALGFLWRRGTFL
jgi:hypothetical protein